MRGTKAKRLRKTIYGKDFSPTYRKYYRTATGQIIADDKLQAYQKAKRGEK
jgi:hypothetical protein